MLLTISGPQGTGKSTVLKTLESDFGFNVIPNKTSRSILAEWNMTLNQVNSEKHRTHLFQQEVIKRHRENDKMYLESEKIWIKERSYLDIFVYALNILGPFNEYSQFVDDYFTECKQYQSAYDCVIYLAGREGYTPEDDGVRSTNKYFTQMIDTSMQHFSTRFDSGNMLFISESNHEKRIKLITNHIDCIKWKGM